METAALRSTAVSAPTGFKGFAELVTDVSRELRGAASAAAQGTAARWPSELEDDHWAINFLEGRPPKKPVVATAVQGTAGLLGWILAQRGGFIILIGGAIWLFSTCSSFFSNSSGSSQVSRTASAPSVAYSPTPPPAPYVPPAEDLSESRPVQGTGMRLSSAEVRYCVFEKVRVTKMRSLASTNRQIDRFNEFVQDYNSRCGNFQYVPWTRDVAEKQARERDAELSAEARSRLGIKSRGSGR